MEKWINFLCIYFGPTVVYDEKGRKALIKRGGGLLTMNNYQQGTMFLLFVINHRKIKIPNLKKWKMNKFGKRFYHRDCFL